MKDLLKITEEIKDKKLREKVVEVLKNPDLKNPEFKYPATPFDKIPAWAVGAHHHYEGGELDHTVGVVKIAMFFADYFEKTYDMKINRDHVIAGALLHDIGKVFLIKRDGKSWAFTGCHLDHADLSAMVLYAHEFPEEVVHIVASHGGDKGQAGADPRTPEAMLVFHADVVDAAVESQTNPSSNMPFQFLLLGDE